MVSVWAIGYIIRGWQQCSVVRRRATSCTINIGVRMQRQQLTTYMQNYCKLVAMINTSVSLCKKSSIYYASYNGNEVVSPPTCSPFLQHNSTSAPQLNIRHHRRADFTWQQLRLQLSLAYVFTFYVLTSFSMRSISGSRFQWKHWYRIAFEVVIYSCYHNKHNVVLPEIHMSIRT